MEKVVVSSCPACDPVNRMINDLLKMKFEIIEEKLEDYHFCQLCFKLKGNVKELKNITSEGFTIVENKYLCNCHWSTIEIVKA